jgi:regulator of nonsense transcripts 2
MNEDTSINEQHPKSSETTQANPESDDLNQLNQFLKERDERYKLKLSQRQLNQSSTSLGGSQAGSPSLRLDDSYLKKLDSSIKRVTSFIKRLKTLTESQKDSLSKDLKQLNLSKYLSEVVAAFLEAKLKMNDLPCALHLCSLMHQSYAEFSGILFDQWQKVLNIKKDEKLANPSKLRVELRFFAELITISVLPEKEALSLLGNQLTILTTYDKDYSNLAVITSFCKHCGEDFADLVPAKFEKLANKHGVKIPRNDLYSIERQKAVKSLFKEYFKSLVQFILTENKEVQKMERQNRKLYQVSIAKIRIEN